MGTFSLHNSVGKPFAHPLAISGVIVVEFTILVNKVNNPIVVGNTKIIRKLNDAI